MNNTLHSNSKKKEIPYYHLIPLLKVEGESIDQYKEVYKIYSDGKKNESLTIKITNAILNLNACIIAVCKHKIEFKNCIFNGNGLFDEITFEKKLSFWECNFEDINIAKFNNNNSILFHECTFNSIKLSQSSFSNVEIKSCKGDLITINDCDFNTFIIESKLINKLSIEHPAAFFDNLKINLENSNISLREMSANNLTINGFYNKSNVIIIDEIQIYRIIIHSLKNFGRLYFNKINIYNNEKEANRCNIKHFLDSLNEHEKKRFIEESPYNQINEELSITFLYVYLTNNQVFWNKWKSFLTKDKKHPSKKESLFVFDESQIGAMELKNNDLNRFDRIIILNTDLSEIKTFNTIFPPKKIHGNDHSLYEIFNDLYTASIEKNNKREENLYYTASKNALFNSIKYKWTKEPSIYISLLISKTYSKFGSRWDRSFFVTTPLLGLICFLLMLIAINIDIPRNADGDKMIANLWAYYFQYLNPTHKISFMDKLSSDLLFSENLWFVFWDFIGRILIGIGIYETIISFRTFSKK